MNIEKIKEYLDLIDSESIKRLYKVFKIFDANIEIWEEEVNIYNFSKEYAKEIRIFEEFGIIETKKEIGQFYLEDKKFMVIASQIEMAKLNLIFKENKVIMNMKAVYF